MLNLLAETTISIEIIGLIVTVVVGTMSILGGLIHAVMKMSKVSNKVDFLIDTSEITDKKIDKLIDKLNKHDNRITVLETLIRKKKTNDI